MINKNQTDISDINVHPQTGYFLASEASDLQYFLIIGHCGDCYKMSRMSMSCYAAAKHTTDKNSTVARIQPKEKPKTTKHVNKYADMETSLSLDKYNGKLMNSIWGLYNRDSPHNFKKQNAEGFTFPAKGQETKTSEAKSKSSFVQFSIPQFTGIVSVETKLEVKKPKTTLEKFENLFSFPIF